MDFTHNFIGGEQYESIDTTESFGAGTGGGYFYAVNRVMEFPEFMTNIPGAAMFIRLKRNLV